MAEPLLKVKNLSVALGDQPILKNLSFEVDAGQTLAIIGPNGAGKTVLFRALIGALPYQGEVEWRPGIKIGYVPQSLNFDPQLSLTLRDFLLLKLKILRLPPTAMLESLKLVHLEEDNLNTKLVHLPAGKLQRALIASALIGEPQVLLFDEPTASVDLPREELIYETLHELQDKKGLTLMLISHDLNLVYRYATQVLCINQQMLCFGEPQKALNTELLSKLYGDRVLYHHPHHGSNHE